MRSNNNLHSAKTEKNDEFYTRLEDIQEELVNYRSSFRGKTVYCNCDNPLFSNFFRYFAENFNILGLKKLICTCYDADSSLQWGCDNNFLNISDTDTPTKAYKVVINHLVDTDNDGRINGKDVSEMVQNLLDTKQSDENIEVGFLHSDTDFLAGDFRSEECVALLKESDVVVTNPPFSLFRDFIALMEKYEKQYLVIGNINAITYKEIFPLIKDDKLWVGYKFNGKPMCFIVPDDYPLSGSVNGILPDGRKYVGVGGTCWFTNLDIRKRHESLIETLYKQYNETDYPTYDNYDAINVDKTSDIPCDYMGVMGVPITFLDKYNPDEFELVGGYNYSKDNDGNTWNGLINGKYVYKRLLIRRK